MYKIVRMYFEGGSRTVESGLSLEEARDHCSSPESSSRTCTSAAGISRTEERGPWFDGYEET